MSPAMAALSNATALADRVRERLVTSGGVVELGHLDRLSASEMDVLVRLERESLGGRA